MTAHYDGAGHPSLENISFTAEAGQTIGIIGGTGSGKTTLINLIPGFYPAAAGKVLIDGKPVSEYDPDFLTFNPPIRAMQNEEGLIRITKELVERLDEEGLIYAELRFAPQYHLEGELTQEDAVKAFAGVVYDVCGI